MRDSKRVQVENGSGELMSNLTSLVFRDSKLSLVHEGEEIAAVKNLHHDVDGVLILKDVIEFDYVRMLAHLQHLYLAFKQLQVLDGELLLLDDLDCALNVCLLVARRLD